MLSRAGLLAAFLSSSGAVRIDEAAQLLAEPRGTVMVDGGSSGSKVFSFDAGEGEALASRSTKVLTACRNPAMPLLGAASLAYNVSECEPFVECSDCAGWYGTPGATLTRASDYVQKLLTYVKELHEHGPGCKELPAKACPAPKNAGQVPMLATAGMRLLSKEQNDAVWGSICGQTLQGDSAYSMAPRGPMCGTIPGTTEAYFEFLADLASRKAGEEFELAGVFTIGGASAQIALPLQEDFEIKAFEWLLESVEREIGDCREIRLSGSGDPIPIFNGGSCVGDFVALKPVGEVPESLRAPLEAKGVKKLGLISFLGLGKDGIFGVAGGANQEEAWALQNACGKCEDAACKASFDWQGCMSQFEKALDGDVMWRLAKQMFTDFGFKLSRFHFNTPAANPQKSFVPADKVNMAAIEQFLTGGQGLNTNDHWKKQLEGLEAVNHLLNENCAANGKFLGGFGFKGANTCTKAFFAVLFGKLPLLFNQKMANGIGKRLAQIAAHERLPKAKVLEMRKKQKEGTLSEEEAKLLKQTDTDRLQAMLHIKIATRLQQPITVTWTALDWSAGAKLVSASLAEGAAGGAGSRQVSVPRYLQGAQLHHELE